MLTRGDTVSVVMPVYNGEGHIAKTIISVKEQTYPKVELIVVDDGSSDSTCEIVKGFDGFSVNLFRQQNQGSAAARNRGVHEASGDWIAFLDADDLWLPTKLEDQLASCGDREWSYTDTIFLGGVNDGRRDSDFTKKYSGDILEELVKGNFISTSTVLVSRQAFLAVGGFDESLQSIQDWELWTRLAAHSPLGYVNKPLTQYRVHANSTSRSTRKTLPNHLRVIDRIFAKDGAGSQFQHLKNSAKARSCGICSYIAEEEGDPSFALRCAFQAWQYEPASSLRGIRVLKVFTKWIFGVVRS